MTRVVAEVLLYAGLIALGFFLFQSEAARSVVVIVGSATITAVLLQQWRTKKTSAQ